MATGEGGKDIWKKVFSRKKDIVFRRVAGEAILVPVRGTAADMKKIFSLNTVGARIWDALDGRRSLGEVREEILASFDAGEEAVDADIREFVAELVRADLVSEGNRR